LFASLARPAPAETAPEFPGLGGDFKFNIFQQIAGGI
jgi:hypothetical protein